MDFLSHAAKILLAILFVNTMIMLALFLLTRSKRLGMSDESKENARKKTLGVVAMTIAATAVIFLFFDQRSTFAPISSPASNYSTLGPDLLTLLLTPALLYAIARAGAAARLAMSRELNSRQHSHQYAHGLAVATVLYLGFTPVAFLAAVVVTRIAYRQLHASMVELFVVALIATVGTFLGNHLVNARIKRWTGVSGKALFAGDVWGSYAEFLAHKGYAQEGFKSP